jgi:hypothetical protein
MKKNTYTALSKRSGKNPQPLPVQLVPTSTKGRAGVVGKPERVPAGRYAVMSRPQAVEFVDKAGNTVIFDCLQ